MKKELLYFLPFLLAVGCADERYGTPARPDGSTGEITLSAEIRQANVSRVDDSGFVDGDKFGVFMVEYASASNPGELLPTGNLADNMKYTLNDGSWTPDYPVYWNDKDVDVYGYYPYDPELASVEAYPFTVEYNQASEPSGGRLGGYEASDFLYARYEKANRRNGTIPLQFNHMMAGVQVTLIEGADFEDGQWADLEKSVLVENTRRESELNLSTGAITLSDPQETPRGIIMAGYKDDYRAVVVPQTVSAGQTLLSITVDGTSYQFTRQSDMVFDGSKMHKFSIKVDRRVATGDYAFTLISEAITAWESDLISHNGKVKEYAVVEMLGPGQMEASLKAAGIDPETVVNLKVKGLMNRNDFIYLRDKVTALEALNLKEATTEEVVIKNGYSRKNSIPYLAFANKRTLKTIVLPDKLEAIGESAFAGAPLTGALLLPEGLEWIGERAFQNIYDGTEYSDFPGGRPQSHNNLTGSLVLPATLKYIGKECFIGCDFTGQLIFPEGLEEIGESAFNACKNLSGELHLPSSLKIIGNKAFSGMDGISGMVNIPEGITEISSCLSGIDVSMVGIPNSAVSIGDNAFTGTKLRGDIVLPSGIGYIGRNAFSGTLIRHISLPSDITLIRSETFADCGNLQDTVVVPSDVEVIESGAFRNCTMVDAVELPEKLLAIKSMAFANCYSLSYMRCQAKTPPQIENESVFSGVAKDNFTLVVPEGCVDAYRNAPVWREFKRISVYKDFIARPSKYNTLNKGGQRSVILNAPGAWEMTYCPAWAHVDKTSGSQKTELKLTVDAMARGESFRSDSIVFRLTDETDSYTTHINLSQYDYEYEEDQCVQLQSATRGNGVDVFIVGDGYDASDISSGIFLRDMKQHMEYFFGVEPYTTYRDYFNVYTSIARSEESGVGTVDRLRDTKFGVEMGDCKTRMKGDGVIVLDYCYATVSPIASKPDPTVVAICVVNYDGYDGVTHMLGESNVSFVTNSVQPYPSDARGITQHEAGGHAFGLFLDEYMYHYEFIQNCKCIDGCGHVAELLAKKARGFGRNISLDGKYKEVEWSHLIFDPRYSDIVDLYEGAFFHSRGVYRSEYNSCMNNNIPYFSTWCRQLIVERIMRLAGETFDFENFVANDKRTMGRDFTSSRAAKAVSTPSMWHNAPVFVDGYCFGAKRKRK